LAGIFFVTNEYVWAYSFAVGLIPASVMLTTVLKAVRCNRLAKVHPKESIIVGVKNAIDTLQLLELSDAGRRADPLVGTEKFCLQSRFMLLYCFTAYSVLLLVLPMIVPWTGEDASELSMILTMVLSSIFLAGFIVEYCTCCKMKYYAKTSEIFNAKIVRCPWVSYIELEEEIER
jgi:MFS family permease